MASTRLGRKARRNKAKAKNRVSNIKRLNTLPTIKNVDVEEIKKEFENGSSAKKSSKKEAPAKEEAKKKDAPKEEKAPKTEKKKADKEEATDKEEK